MKNKNRYIEVHILKRICYLKQNFKKKFCIACSALKQLANDNMFTDFNSNTELAKTIDVNGKKFFRSFR